MIIEKSSLFIIFKCKKCYLFHIPKIQLILNLQKPTIYQINRFFYKDFDGLFRFEIAPFFEGENLIFVRPLFMLNALCPDEC